MTIPFGSSDYRHGGKRINRRVHLRRPWLDEVSPKSGEKNGHLRRITCGTVVRSNERRFGGVDRTIAVEDLRNKPERIPETFGSSSIREMKLKVG